MMRKEKIFFQKKNCLKGQGMGLSSSNLCSRFLELVELVDLDLVKYLKAKAHNIEKYGWTAVIYLFYLCKNV